MLRHRRSVFCASLLCAALFAAGAVAARDYERLTFQFSAPAQLKVSANGNQLVLNFDQPTSETRASILAKAGPHASDVSIEEDGKKVVITLDAPYRTRQFTSRNKVGLDILTGDAKELPVPVPAIAPAADKPKPAEKPVETATAPGVMTTKPVAEPTSTSIMTTKEALPPPLVPSPEPATVPTPVVEPVTVPTAIPAAAQEEPAPVTAAPAAVEPHAGEPVSETTSPATPEEAHTTIEETAPVASDTVEEVPAVVEGTTTEATEFLVTTKDTDGGIWINFPWEHRTAAATFERTGDIWIVFARPQPINIGSLRTAMPKSIIAIEQFYSSTHTILRLTTDGTLRVTARQPKGSYRWHIQLSPRPVPPVTDISVNGQSEDDITTYLLFGLYGSGAPLSFYDPRVGDKVYIVPTYEEGHGLTEARHFPAIDVHPTQQGLVITSLRDDLRLDYSRIGLKLTGAGDLSVSRNLPILTTDASPVRSATGTTQVMMPYNQWHVAPGDYLKVRAERIRNIANATPAARPDAIFSMVQLALSQGYMVEAMGYLNLLRTQYPNYYSANQLGILRGASNLLLNRIKDAEADINSPDLEMTDELQLWRDAVGLYTPAVNNVAPLDGAELAAQKGALSNTGVDIEATPSAPTIVADAKEFNFVNYNQNFIRFYPPAIRQRLAILAAEYYFKSGEPEQAIAVFDTLNRDNILTPVKRYAELALGKTAAKKNQNKEALDILEKLAEQHEDRYVQMQARYEETMLKYRNSLITASEAEEELERIRMGWRGDPFEHKVLNDLASLYSENKQYDNTLRVWKYLLTSFPGDPNTLKIAGDMSELFQYLFLGGEADAMEPLKALALFYEFRELTPVGEKGDEIIQHLADRLAAVDLLDRAATLLDHQIKFRASGESRARIGARLALIALLNQEPARALEALQTTSFGGAAPELQRQRRQLTAQALSRLGKHEDALVMLYSDTSREGGMLRMDILWAMQDWSNIVNQAEDLLSERPNLTETLTTQETTILLKLALAYNFEGDYTQLGYLRDYYIALVPESPMKEIFSFLTNDTTPIDTEDFEMVARQIARTEGFLDSFRKKIAEGKLSEAIAEDPAQTKEAPKIEAPAGAPPAAAEETPKEEVPAAETAPAEAPSTEAAEKTAPETEKPKEVAPAEAAATPVAAEEKPKEETPPPAAKQ